ncbi:hypothetical protein CEP54_010063 [Fusarium duplospermum]|uniref:Uncharacterized protein n=1 Tax=Fusarium duplospermum TaxID=1325734 RepID=A0A428PM65_9HYPO|nr:hypothetical protein CEP54_010063 [Fusarium duplospermum]
MITRICQGPQYIPFRIQSTCWRLVIVGNIYVGGEVTKGKKPVPNNFTVECPNGEAIFKTTALQELYNERHASGRVTAWS